MPAEQINITLGTAGHIDHGKTALVKSLTGCETDRLKEEKERGMSIDLGFAPCRIADLEVGIVDVPGHENFVKTMVAGASGMDAVILVVAADDGIMPQTREHLDILTLLGVQHGLVALTKIDRVEPEHRELACDELRELLRDMFLAGAPILPVSNVTGEGFGPFYEALAALVEAVTPKRIDGVFRLPVDRAFSVKGYGTVVAGVPIAGSARIGDELVLLPQGLSGQIRSIQVYGRDSDVVKAGQCAALNVRPWEHRGIERGNVAAAPGYFTPSEWFACSLRMLPQEKLFRKTKDKFFLKSGARVKFHTGTSEVIAALYPMQGSGLQAGEVSLVQVRVEQPLVAGPGDHFIVRTIGPVQTIGGGTIIEAVPRRLRRNQPHVYEDLQQRAAAVRDERQFVEYCVRRAEGLAATEPEIAARAKVPRDRTRTILEDLLREGKLSTIGAGRYLHRDTAAEAAERIVAAVADFHRRAPESPGIPREQLCQDLQLDKEVLAWLVARLKAEGRLVERAERLAAPEHRSSFADEDAKYLEAIEASFRQSPFQPPGLPEVAQQTGAAPQTVARLVKILCEHQRLVRVAEDLVFHREAVDRAREILIEFLRKEGKLESVRFKYLLDTTRKHAIPLLDYFDRIGVTRRVGNTRYLKTPPVGGK